MIQNGRPNWTGIVRELPDRLGQPLRWARPRRVFVNSMSDLFHPDVSDGFIARVWDVMGKTPLHTYQILTKRPERMRDWVTRWADLTGEPDDFMNARGPAATQAAHPSGRGQLFAAMLSSMGDPPPGCAYPTFDWAEGQRYWPRVLPNVWLGISVEHQGAADDRIPHLLATPAAVRFLSCEPLLDRVDLSPFGAGLGWVIAGGESGPRSRPMEGAWVLGLIEQTRDAGTPMFVKQMGCVYAQHHGLRDPKGGGMEEWPELLRVREFPDV